MTFYDLIDYSTLLSPVALLLGIILCSLRFRKLSRAHRIIAGYLLLALLTDLVTRFYVFSYNNNLIFIVVFSLLELLLFYGFYFRVFSNKRHPVLLFIVPAGILYILWELLSHAYIRDSQFQSYSKVVDTFLVLTMSVAYFFERLQKPTAEIWQFFRLNAIVLVFFSFHLVFFLPISFLVNNDAEIQLYLWFLHLLVTVVFYLFLITELWRNGRIRKHLQPG